MRKPSTESGTFQTFDKWGCRELLGSCPSQGWLGGWWVGDKPPEMRPNGEPVWREQKGVLTPDFPQLPQDICCGCPGTLAIASPSCPESHPAHSTHRGLHRPDAPMPANPGVTVEAPTGQPWPADKRLW